MGRRGGRLKAEINKGITMSKKLSFGEKLGWVVGYYSAKLVLFCLPLLLLVLVLFGLYLVIDLIFIPGGAGR
jgi:hypothetical protein